MNSSGDLGKFEIVEPRDIGPLRCIPDHIVKPGYYETGEVISNLSIPEIKSSEQIDGMIQSSKLASLLLKNVGDFIKVPTNYFCLPI